MKLRDYQSDLVDGLREAIKAGQRSPIAVSPTGSGKSVILAHIAGSSVDLLSKTLVIVHRKELLLQLSKTFDAFGLDHGFIAAGIKPDYSKRIQIGMVASLKSRLENIPDFNLIIIDECHHAVSPTYVNALARFPNAAKIGFTATPQRLDGKGLGAIYDKIVQGPTVAWLMEAGFLSRVKAYSIPSDFDTDGIKTVAGDYNKRQVAEAVEGSSIVGDAVNHYQKLGKDMPAVAFCHSIDAADNTAQAFNAAGIASASISSRMKSNERTQVVDDLTHGKIQVLTSVDVVSEGFDLPKIGVAILLRPTQSLGVHLQQVGRILRPFEGKDHSVIIDHVGNVPALGMPQDSREWSLKDRPKGESRADSFVTCKECYAIYSQFEPSCPECGAVRTKSEREDLKVLEGELEEFTENPYKNHTLTWRDDFEIVKKVAKAKGFKIGWAYHKARSLKIKFPFNPYYSKTS